MMDRILRFAVISLAGGFGSMAFGARDEGTPPAPPERANKLRVLIVTGGHAFERESFFKMFSVQKTRFIVIAVLFNIFLYGWEGLVPVSGKRDIEFEPADLLPCG